MWIIPVIEYICTIGFIVLVTVWANKHYLK